MEFILRRAVANTAAVVTRKSQYFRVFSRSQHLSIRRYSSSQAEPNLSSSSMSSSRSTAAADLPPKKDITKYILAQVDDIIKSPEDKRSYRILTLSNQMKALLVSDPTTDKSAASLDVNVGHLKDPRNLPGIAHFCEHMLFLGTDKYPSENEYHKYLSNHGGAANAYTGSDHTNYFFDVAPDHLVGALDRFSQFFLTPQFTESATDREVNAVDSENQNYQKEDGWRMVQMERSLSDPNHDYSKFGTGNRETLWDNPKKDGLNPRDELMKFHSEHYSSNIMRLCILGKEPLDELTQLTVDMFADVANKSAPSYAWSDHPWGTDQLGRTIDIVPIKDIRQMSIMFPVPDFRPHYRSQPDSYVSHLLGHEGSGSLLSLLKSNGWVNSLSAGFREGGKGFGFFNVSVDLSEDGLKHTDEIVFLTFNYLRLIRENGVQEWMHDECRKLNEIGFQFKDKSAAQSTAMNLAVNMHEYEPREVLKGPYIMDEWNPERINQCLDHLNPDNFTVFRMSKEFENSDNLKKERWYQTEYAETPFSSEFKAKCMEAFLSGSAAENSKLILPKPNPFIPTDFSIKATKDTPDVHPKIIKDTSYTRLWYKLDTEFLLPKAVASFNVTSPVTFDSPTSQNLAYMYSVVLSDALTEFTYDASLGGLGYGVSSARNGMSLSVSGYNHKMGLLLEKLVSEMVNLKVDPSRFEVLKEAYVRGLQNFYKEQPYQQAIANTDLLLSTRGWSVPELLADVNEEVTVEALEEFIPRFLKRMHLEALIYGNVSEEESKAMVDSVWKAIETSGPVVRKVGPLYPSQIIRDREYQIPAGGPPSAQEFVNPVHTNSACEMLLQIGTSDERGNIMVQLLAQLMSEPAFDTLRTKESLGYIVFSGTRQSHGVNAMRFIVQGEKDPSYVESRVEVFLQNMRTRIADMPDEEFEKNKEALAVQRLEKPKKLKSKSVQYWGEIIKQTYNFERDEREVAILRGVAKPDVLQFYDNFLRLDAPQRRKLITSILSKDAQSSHEEFTERKSAEIQESLKELNDNLPKPELVKERSSWQIKRQILNHPEPLIALEPKGMVVTDG